jgi:hypothetical protein
MDAAPKQDACKIEVTPEMIVAGREEYAQFFSRIISDRGVDDPVEEMLAAVYRAMTQVRP